MTKGKVKNYKEGFEKHGLDPKALRWQSARAARQRYEQIVADIDFNYKSVLDVGCGFADIVRYISKKTRNFKYTGVDIVPEFVRQARKLYPEYKFVVRNYFKNPLKKNFDIVICSGVLNSNVSNNMGFRKKAIRCMFDHAKEALVFNMAGRYPRPKTSSKSNVWFSDPLEILEYCLSLTKRVILRNHYHSRDFTVLVFR